MNIVACIGSYRKQGNTARIVKLIEKQMRLEASRVGETVVFETVYLGHREILPCRGCRVCFDQGEERCPLKDDTLAIKVKMAAADALLVASPVYVNDVSGTIKNWLDRLAHVNHRPEFAGKCAYLVATVGEGPTRHALRTLHMAISGWGYHIAGQSGFKMGALMKQPQLETSYKGETRRIARRFFRSIYERRFSRPSFVSLMTFKIQQLYWQRNGHGSTDFDYWNSRGWTRPEAEYYIPHKASGAKVALARLTGTILARYVT